MIFDFVDFLDIPFTVPESNFVVCKRGTSLEIYCVEYERPLADCVVAEILPKDTSADVTAQADGGHFSFGSCAVAIYRNSLWIHSAGEFVVKRRPHHVSQTLSFDNTSDGDVLISYSGSLVPPDGDLPTSWHSFRDTADGVVQGWMERMPQVSEQRKPMTEQCWWVLGTNLVRFVDRDGATCRSIVPAKLGYVGLWQWDAYFIAIGVAHGDFDAALEQLRNAVKFQADTGQLPDVLFPGGVLANSSDLPEADRLKLEADGSPTVGGGTVPLTKPPLLAWTIEQILGKRSDVARQKVVEEFADVVADNQEWWFSYSDIRANGLPEYLHPYSSGLDDSPVFDHEVPVATADLAAYLGVQDAILSQWFSAIPKRSVAFAARSQRTHQKMLELWDETLGMFRYGHDARIPQHRTIVSLLGVFDGRLPDSVVSSVLSDIHDPGRFATDYPLPTVALDDDGYRANIMWRGPTWINTTFLIADGLARQGYPEEARSLRTAILDNIEKAGGPVEYLNPSTGIRCEHAVRSFSWSAALYVDCAVREFSESVEASRGGEHYDKARHVLVEKTTTTS